MGSQGLLEYIEEAVQENPVLEPEGPMTNRTVLRPPPQAGWLESTDPQEPLLPPAGHRGGGQPLNNFGTVQDDDENLYYYVLSQLRVLELEPK